MLGLKKARVLVPEKHFEPSLIFIGVVWSLPLEGSACFCAQAKKVRVFVLDKPVKPSLIFAGVVRSLPLEWSNRVGASSE